jgi:hypothetical protein
MFQRFSGTPSNNPQQETKTNRETMSTVLFEKVSWFKATTNMYNDEQVYCKDYTIADVVKDLVHFYELMPGISMIQFLGYHSTVPKSTFQHHYEDSLLKERKARNKPVAKARVTAAVYLANLLKRSQSVPKRLVGQTGT